uniref:Uncharacterized protein n=1 Tax=Eutreptiella gymnastica TaxID=73025 RepID=A0A7S1N958_9EUGL
MASVHLTRRAQCTVLEVLYSRKGTTSAVTQPILCPSSFDCHSYGNLTFTPRDVRKWIKTLAFPGTCYQRWLHQPHTKSAPPHKGCSGPGCNYVRKMLRPVQAVGQTKRKLISTA